jgi:hypothetical protein
MNFWQANARISPNCMQSEIGQPTRSRFMPWSSVLWRSAETWQDTIVSENRLHPVDGGSMVLRNVGILHTITLCHNTEDHDTHLHCRENLESRPQDQKLKFHYYDSISFCTNKPRPWSRSLEKLIVTQLVNNSPHLLHHEGSLSCSQEPVKGAYPEIVGWLVTLSQGTNHDKNTV